MKQFIVILCLLFMVSPTSAAEQEVVTLDHCIDGDTAGLIVKGEQESVRFLAIDTPEYTKEKEPYGKEASNFVCNALEQAEQITLEYEPTNDRDKYGRLLAWVFVDGALLQEKVISEGLAEVAYIYDDYKYTDRLYEAQDVAKKEKLNLWSGEEPVDYTTYIGSGVVVVLMILVLSFKKKGKRSSLKKLSKHLKK